MRKKSKPKKPIKTSADPLVTRERASQLLDKNVRTIARALGNSKPDEVGPPAKYYLSTVRKALTTRAQKVGEKKSEAPSTLTAAKTLQTEERARLLQLDRL